MPDTSWADKAAKQRATGDTTDRLARIAKFWQAYHGTSPKPLVVNPGAPDDNLRVNLARSSSPSSSTNGWIVPLTVASPRSVPDASP